MQDTKHEEGECRKWCDEWGQGGEITLMRKTCLNEEPGIRRMRDAFELQEENVKKESVREGPSTLKEMWRRRMKRGDIQKMTKALCTKKDMMQKKAAYTSSSSSSYTVTSTKKRLQLIILWRRSLQDSTNLQIICAAFHPTVSRKQIPEPKRESCKTASEYFWWLQ